MPKRESFATEPWRSTARSRSLRRFKDDVREVAEGFECGIQIAKFQDLKERDIIEAYATEHIAAELVRA